MTGSERWMSEDECKASEGRRINTFRLWGDGEGWVNWNCPDGYCYKFHPDHVKEGVWHITPDVKGKPAMAYHYLGNEDATLVVSLQGANSLAATLLHEEDDRPKKYYYATDNEHQTVLNRPSFVLRAEGHSRCPITRNHGLRVMTVRG